jgi:hypothetical protein
MNALAACNAGTITTHTFHGARVNGFGGAANGPDFTETACISGGGGELALVANTLFALHYSAELGSVAGIANALGNAGVQGPAGAPYPLVNYPTTHPFLQWVAGDCTLATETAGGTGTCGNGTVAYALEASNPGPCPPLVNQAVAGTNVMCQAEASIVIHAPDIAVADLEPIKFVNDIDWPTKMLTDLAIPQPAFKAFGNPPTSDDISLNLGGGTVNGEVFVVGVANVPGGNPANLSSSSISSIFQGNYKKWQNLPEVGLAKDPGAGTLITICRRDNGSGTQVTTNATFTGGPECGLPGVPFLPGNATAFPNPGKVIVNTTTADVVSCLQAAGQSAIGAFGLQGNDPPAAGIAIPNIDGVEPNAHNAAAGYYKFYSETWAQNLSGIAAANTMIADAKTNAGLVLNPGVEATGPPNANLNFHSAAPIGFFSLPIAGNGIANTVENATGAPGFAAIVPNAVFTDSGEECALKTPNNVNNP